MKATDIYQLATRALKGNRLRTNLTISIIAIGITALIGIITVIEVLKGTIQSSFTSMGSNTFSITQPSIQSGKHGGKRRGASTSSEQKISLKDAENFHTHFLFPATISISMGVNSGATVMRGKKKSNPNISIVASDENYLKVNGTNLEVGRNFTQTDYNSGNNTCIVGYAIGEKYFGKMADAENGILQIGNTQYRVLGVMESKGSSFINRTDNMVIISLNNAKKKYALGQNSATINVMVNDIKLMDLATDEAEGYMRQIKGLPLNEPNDFSINKNNDVANSLLENIQFVTIAASVIGLITLFGAAIGLMNIMLVSVAERTREIGLTKAIGANTQTIKSQFLTEAIIISLKGGFIGIVIGIAIGNILSLVLKANFVVPWIWIAISISLCFAVGLLAGIYPALKASRLNPIHALRYE